MLAEITKNNADNFKALVPRIELQRLEKDEDRFGIGYMDDPDGFPDGVLLFKLDILRLSNRVKSILSLLSNIQYNISEEFSNRNDNAKIFMSKCTK